MTDEEYLELGRYIWKTYVPQKGQAETVQGELLRAAAKLRDECHRNGNINWGEGHEVLARFIYEKIRGEEGFSEDQIVQTQSDISRILDYQHPYAENDLFDRVDMMVLDWCKFHPNPIVHASNPELKI